VRKAGLLVLAGALVLVARASADVCASRWSAGQGGPHPGTVKVLQEGTGGVIQFDLGALPAKAKVYRARLYVGRGDIEFGQFGRPVLTGEEAPVRCEVYPLAGAYQAGQPPRTDQKPLDPVGPWCACLDMTECVSQWAAGKKANHGLYVKALPGWQADQTCLEIAYEGKPDALPPQASGIKVLHRAGQTFITWKDTEDSFGDGPVT
jgi:hypothetical protein